MKNLKKILTFVMMFAVLLSMTVTANAADTYSITVNNKESGHTYEAYQIFTGDYSLDANGQKILSNIKWGANVNSSGLMTALVATDTFADVAEVADITEILDTNESSAVEFAKLAGDYVTGTPATSSRNGDTGYIISGLSAGYYLVKDQNDTLNNKNETYTSYILRVVGDAEVNAKSGTTTVNKHIVTDGTETKTDDYSVGDTVEFRLTGTLPDNYGEFTAFEYEFVDVMSKGLTYTVNSAKVYIANDGDPVEITDGFVVKTSGGNGEDTTIKVKFENLKTNTKIDKDTTIIVEYSAVLNNDAVIGGEGNPNQVHIEYSNNPYDDDNGSNDDDNKEEDDDDKGETPKDYVYVFTFELDVTKTDADGEALANAEFVLINSDGKYAVLDSDKFISSWTDDKSNATTLVSGTDGLFVIKGLDAGTYSLEETKAPAGYDLLTDPISIVIYAEVSKGTEGGQVNVLTIKVGEKDAANGDTATGIVAMDVVNNPGITLPETGGIGTTLFYIIGGVIVVGAIVALITKKRMGRE